MSKHTCTQCQACENTSVLQLWLRAKVSLNNGCQVCPVEDSPLAGKLAASHVAVPLFVYPNTTGGNMPAPLLPAPFYNKRALAALTIDQYHFLKLILFTTPCPGHKWSQADTGSIFAANLSTDQKQ